MPELTTEEKGAIESFKAKAREFWTLWQAMDQRKHEVANMPPALRDEYKDLMDRGVTIRGSIEYITGLVDKAAAAYDSVKNWIMDKFGLSGLHQVDPMARQLGIIPLIPVAVIGTALTLIGSWVADAYTLQKKLDEQHRLEAKGLSPAEASAIVERTVKKPGLFGDVGKLAMPLLFVGAAGLGLYFWSQKQKGNG